MKIDQLFIFIFRWIRYADAFFNVELYFIQLLTKTCIQNTQLINLSKQKVGA